MCMRAHMEKGTYMYISKNRRWCNACCNDYPPEMHVIIHLHSMQKLMKTIPSCKHYIMKWGVTLGSPSTPPHSSSWYCEDIILCLHKMYIIIERISYATWPWVTVKVQRYTVHNILVALVVYQVTNVFPFHDTGCSYHTLQILIVHTCTVPVQCCAGSSGGSIPSGFDCWSMYITQHSSSTGGTVFSACVFRVAYLNKS